MAVFRFIEYFLLMEAARTSETSVNFQQSTRRNNPEDGHLYIHPRNKLKSRTLDLFGQIKLYITVVNIRTTSHNIQ
jgi:hypothetical protein